MWSASPIQIPPNDVNKGYLHTKLTKLDHLLQTELVEPEAQRPVSSRSVAMVRELRGSHNGNGLQIAIVVSRFNEAVTSKLLQGALDGLFSHGVLEQDITVAWVPGSFEIPVVAQNLTDTGEFDAIICLGAVIRHETDHHFYVAREANERYSQRIARVGCPHHNSASSPRIAKSRRWPGPEATKATAVMTPLLPP